MTKNINKFRREYKILLVVFTLVLIAVICRLISRFDIVIDGFNYLSSLLRSLIYIGIIATWGISVQNRVINRSVRKYMLAVVFLLLYWFIIRTCKFHFLRTFPLLQTYCWYGYYIPMLFIPLIGIYISSFLGKGENHTLSKPLKSLMIPGVIFVLLILTNNFHQLIFAFPFGIVGEDPFYIYKPLYYVCIGWILIETISFLILLFAHSRVPHKRKRIWAPMIPVAVGFLYVVFYIIGNPILFLIAGDITAFLSLVVIGVCEACIQSRLIPSNIRYNDLFNVSTIGAQIVDENYNICFASNNSRIFAKEIMRRTENGFVEIENEKLSGAHISGGYILWVEDISMVKNLLKKLERISLRLSENNKLLEAELELKKKQAIADEQKRIYDKITEEVKPQLKYLESLLYLSNNNEKIRENLERICIISSYIKRYGNLILLSEESNFLLSQELEYCIRESIENLRVSGVSASCLCKCEGFLSKDSALATYAFFEMIIESTLTTINAILVNLEVKSESVKMTIAISCESESIKLDKAFLLKHNATAFISRQENDIYITFLLPKEVQ